MGKVKELVTDIQEMISNTQKSFQEIADYFGVSVQMVYKVAEEMGEFDE
jgi:Zn-dependent peptidase ImmA (M78 family)